MELNDLFRNIRYVTLKVTNGCNLKCAYCNVEALTPRTPMMSMDTYQHVARLLIENTRHPFINLEFHGGEPLLLSDEWFEEATTFARALARRKGKMIEFPLVTNGTMLTRDRLRHLQNLGIKFCMSCDGPPQINDINRQAGSAVERAIRLFQEEGVHTGIICVMSRSNYSRMTEVMDWFNEVGVPNFRINFVQPQGRGMEVDLLSGEEMFEGMRSILDHMVDTRVAVEEVDMSTFVERFVNGRPRPTQLSCWESECQAGRTYVAVDLSGRIHACGTDLENHVLGSLDKEIDESHYQEKLERLHDKGDWIIRCFDCPARQICNHSCPTSDYNSEEYKENECLFTKLLWKHLCENPRKARMVDAVLKERRRRYAPRYVPVVEPESAGCGRQQLMVI